MSESEHLIVAGLLQRPTRLADLGAIEPSHLTDPGARALYKFALSYHEQRGGRNALDLPLARAKLQDSSSKIAPKLLRVIEEYEEFDSISNAEFREAVVQLARERQESLLRDHGAKAVEAIVAGDFEGAKRAMQAGLVAANDADLEDDSPTNIRGSKEVAREKVRVEQATGEEAQGSFEIGFSWITRAVSLRRREMSVLGGYTADGKALAHGTPVLTPGGWVSVEDVRTGDRVIGRDGLPTIVTGVFRQGVRSMLRVTFADGFSLDVDSEHLWSVQDSNDVRAKTSRTLTTREISESVRSGSGRLRWRVPMVDPVYFDPQGDLPLDPYVLGVLLGDGVAGGGVYYCPGDGRVPIEVADALPSGVETYVVPCDVESDKAARWSISSGRNRNKNPVLEAMKALGLQGLRSWEKFVPTMYLRASVSERLSLLQGLVDTDSDVASRGSRSFVFTSSSKALRDGVTDLVRSLGGLARERVKEVPGYRDSYECCCSFPSDLIPTRAWRNEWEARKKNRACVRSIVSVERVGRSEATCLAVDAHNSLFVVDGYVVTHNTQLSKAIAYNANQISQARVLYTALEMDRSEMIVLFVAQHAATLNPRGVDYRSILDGTATPDDKALYLKALDDWQIRGGKEDVKLDSAQGSLHVWAPRKRINMRDFVNRVESMQADEGLDIVVADYLELIQPNRDLGQYRLNVKEMCERSKSLAREQDVWMILNHQISRKGRDEAEKRHPKHYLLRDLGESSGVERSADHVFWIYSDHDLKDEREAKVGIAKARKGATVLHGRHVYADFSKSLVGELGEE